MTTLTIEKIGDRHRYLADARPEWSASMASIRRRGGPWYCGACDAASYLCYRCSICGRDLADDGGMGGR
jgi:hypothetical protein